MQELGIIRCQCCNVELDIEESEICPNCGEYQEEYLSEFDNSFSYRENPTDKDFERVCIEAGLTEEQIVRNEEYEVSKWVIDN